MNTMKKTGNLISKNKLKFSILTVMCCYVFICQSCIRMRMSKKETKDFFSASKTVYEENTIQFENFKVHYIETGNKEASTLFLVHGSPGSWDAYKEYLNDSLLLSKYRMIAVDRIGFGRSNFGDSQNLSLHAKILEKIADSLNNGRPIYLVGHSYGGPTIVQMATDRPQNFKKLIILAGALDPKAETPENWRAVIKTIPLRYLIPGALRPSNDELWWLKKDLYVLQPNLSKLISEVIIIHGTKDPLVPYKNVAYMQKEFINAKSIKVIPIENANHFIPWEHFEEIRDVLYKLE